MIDVVVDNIGRRLPIALSASSTAATNVARYLIDSVAMTVFEIFLAGWEQDDRPILAREDGSEPIRATTDCANNPVLLQDH